MEWERFAARDGCATEGLVVQLLPELDGVVPVTYGSLGQPQAVIWNR